MEKKSKAILARTLAYAQIRGLLDRKEACSASNCKRAWGRLNGLWSREQASERERERVCMCIRVVCDDAMSLETPDTFRVVLITLA